MVKKITIKGIAFVVLMLSAVLVGMAALSTIAFAAPTIEVTASNTTPQVNQTIIITSTVMDNGSNSTSLDNGTMEFRANSSTFNSTTITNGIAGTTFTTATAGTVTITAFFNSTLQRSTTVTFSALQGPALVLDANPTNVSVNTPTNVNFTVKSGGAAVSGATVTLSQSGVTIGSGTTDTSGIATISVNATAAGTITATATMTDYTSGSIDILAVQPQLNISANQTNVTVNTPTDVNFTVTTSAGAAVSGATVTLSLSGVTIGSSTTDTSGIATISINATAAGTITATAAMTDYTSGNTFLIAVIATDTTPPASVTNLAMQNNGTNWIYWTWTNPTDADFSKVMVYIDGLFKQYVYKPDFSYNATNLIYGDHNISTQTVDTAGNINSTWINLTGSTLPNTPASPPSPINVTLSQSSVSFASVITAGNTVENIGASVPTLPSSDYTAVGNYVNISTTATYTASVTVSVKYDTTRLPPGYSESDIRLYHWNESGQWDNVTTSVDTANDMVIGQVSSLSPFVAAVHQKPVITKVSPADPVSTTGTSTQTFDIRVSQDANITWTIGSSNQSNSTAANTDVTFVYMLSSPGNYTVSVTASNANGSDTESWNWTVHPKTYAAGNRIWDGGRPDLFSLKYTWNPMSFSGFYYDINSDVGNESITMQMTDYTSRTVKAGNILYDTTPEEVNFGYTGFGSYQVIGFMADKYFAGYTSNTTIPGAQPSTTFAGISALSHGQLHKVLMDDDTKRTVSVGGTLTLQEGYVLKAVDIDLSARTMLVQLLKDGNIVDSGTPLNAGQTYVYAPSKVGSVSNLPLIMIRFDSVFSGTEVQAAFLRGVFQISSSPTSVKTGDLYNDMKVTNVGQNLIEMSNPNDVSLSRGNTENLMGNIDILVADNDTLRFALSTEQTGAFEVRSTVYRGNDTNPIDTWTPYNFGMNVGKTSIGFYYDLDDGIGNESLRLAAPLTGNTPGSTISAQNLVYTTTPEDVGFGYSGFGSYQVIGFMADKYFAGYTVNSTPPNPTTNVVAKSTIAQGQLHKVLMDDDTKRTVSVGGTLTLQEGYVLKAVDIDLSARTMLVQLLKDGNIVDSGTPLNAGQTYVYAPSRVGAVSDLPLIMIRFDSVFSGTEVQAAFLRGVFQISSNPTTIKTGDTYNDMKVTNVGQDIEMSNTNAISLDNGKIEQLMGNINLKVGDTSATDNALRFYFAVDVTQQMLANQLVINAPTKATAGDVLNIGVTAGGTPLDGVSVAVNSADAGQTDTNGMVNYTLPKTLKGIYNITATKLGYQQGTSSIEVLQYIEYRLSIDAPANANQFETITIRATYNGTAVSGVTVGYDNATIGTTDNNGVLNYTLQTSGTHTISASKSGYITAVRDINIRAPFSQYQALNINITPGTVFVNEPALIRSNITNVGTKADTLPVELISNGTAVDNRSVSLAPGETKEINFTRKEALVGNYTIEILGQKGILEVKNQPTNYLLIGVIVTVIGLVVIYLLTAKGILGNLLGKFGKKGIEKVKK
ncbi:S-layer protein [uncultured archaeon]|nr:S-layer protein [uncultured archaeon]